MRKIQTRWIAFLMTVLMLTSVFPIVTTEQTALAQTAETDLSALSETGLKLLSRKSYDSIYTPLSLEGVNVPLLAFTGKTGKTEYRVYGQIGKKKGYYPVQFSVVDPEADPLRFVLELESSKPVKDNGKSKGKITVSRPADVLPSDVKVSRKNVISFTNVFGTKEQFVYGTADSANYGYFKAGKNATGAGSLMYDLEEILARVKPDHVRKVGRPKELKSGYRETVLVITSNGFLVRMETAYPAIDFEYVARKQQETRKSGSTETMTTTELIPYGTSYVDNPDLYVSEVPRVIQTGVAGEKKITWKITYKTGKRSGGPRQRKRSLSLRSMRSLNAGRKSRPQHTSILRTSP